MLLTAAANVSGWLCIAFGTEFNILMIGRVTTGLAVGMVTLAVPVFISEVSPKGIRGILDTTCSVSVTLGILLSYVLGKWLNYSQLAMACVLPPVLAAVVVPWFAESPRWLLLAGRPEASLRALHSYRGPNVSSEYEAMNANAVNSGKFSLLELRKPYVYKPFILVSFVWFLQPFSGISIITFYTHDIFSAAGLSSSASDSAIVIGAVIVVTVGIAATLADRLGRRVLFLFSSAVASVSLLVLGAFSYCKTVIGMEVIERYDWLPIFFFVPVLFRYMHWYLYHAVRIVG